MGTNKLKLYASIKNEEPSAELASILGIPPPDKRQPDLQYITAVFVSSGFNLNGAYFLPSELYKAKETINEKALDIEHENDKVVGHLYDSAFTYKDGTVFDIEELASTVGDSINKVSMDIISSMRLYKERFPEVAKDVDDGKYGVSMMCFYQDFDIIVDDIIIPNEEAKRLGLVEVVNNVVRVKEGAISKGKHVVGRVLRNMLFSGCGLVETPANPDSVILETAGYNDKYVLDLTKVDSYMKHKQRKESIEVLNLRDSKKQEAHVDKLYGGVHIHELSTTSKDSSLLDGAHIHYVLTKTIPEGIGVYFTSDGAHRHSVDFKNEKLKDEKGHVHKVFVFKESGDEKIETYVVETGPSIRTHSHDLVGLDADVKYDFNGTSEYYSLDVTAGDLVVSSRSGSHYHIVELKDGTKLETVSLSDLISETPSNGMDDKDGKEGAGYIDGRPLSTPDICVSYKKYVYKKGGDNNSEPVNADYDGVVPRVDSNPAPGISGAGDTITQNDEIIHEEWCSLFDTECTVPGGMAVHPDCLRLVLDRTTKEAVSNYFEKLQENRKNLGVSKALSSLNKILEEIRKVTDV